MIVKVLGKGCKNCSMLEEIARTALEELNVEFEIIKVTDINQIADYGVMRTPALVVNESLILEGRLPQLSEMKSLLIKYK